MTTDWLAAALALVALGAGIAWVALPIWRGAPPAAADDPRVVGLLAVREAALATLRDLDEDARDGRLGVDDHARQRAEVIAQGAAALAALDRIAASRAGNADVGAAAIEADVLRSRGRTVGGT